MWLASIYDVVHCRPRSMASGQAKCAAGTGNLDPVLRRFVDGILCMRCLRAYLASLPILPCTVPRCFSTPHPHHIRRRKRLHPSTAGQPCAMNDLRRRAGSATGLRALGPQPHASSFQIHVPYAETHIILADHMDGLCAHSRWLSYLGIFPASPTPAQSPCSLQHSARALHNPAPPT